MSHCSSKGRGYSRLNSILKDKVKILIIDDDELSNESLKLLLENILSHRSEINSIYGGDIAIEEIEKNKYDIVFLDNKLPDISGMDILKEIKRKNIKTNVIFLTGYSDEELAVKAMKLGAIDYISKGNLDIKRLIEAINEIILDSCSVLDISPEIISKIQSIFSSNEEIIPHQTFGIKYEDLAYEKEIFESLDILYKNRYIEKTKTFSTIACPYCVSVPEEVYLVCPVCSSFDLSKGEVIEHNKCHHIDFKSNFVDVDSNFVCPKCGETLKQIGVDYIKVGINYRCENSHIFQYPEHRYLCKECGKEFSEDESKLIDVYKYKILYEGKISLNICDSINESEYMENVDETMAMYK